MAGQPVLELFAASLILVSSMAFAQKTVTPTAHGVKGQVPNRILDLTHVETLLGLPAATVTGGTVCSSDGDIFEQVYGVSDKPEVAFFPVIYSVSEQREVKKISLPMPKGYKQFVLGSLFPAESRVVGLIEASQPTDSATPLRKGELAVFLATADRDGDRQTIVRLDLGFEPMKAAIFELGEFLVLGNDRANMKPVLAIVHEDGTLDRMLDLDTRTYGESHDLDRIYERRTADSNTDALRRLMIGALSAAEFIPWGKEVLLVQRGSKLPVYRFDDSGELGAVTIKPPDGFLLDAILGSSEKDTWVVSTKGADSFKKVATGGVVENAPQHLFEVNPRTGEVIDQLSIKGPRPGQVACAADGRLAAIYYGLPQQANVPDQLGYASAPR
jgi:hypothetical protein